jgi:hypothetical protein
VMTSTVRSCVIVLAVDTRDEVDGGIEARSHSEFARGDVAIARLEGFGGYGNTLNETRMGVESKLNVGPVRLY